MSNMLAYCPQCGHIFEDNKAGDIKDFRINTCRFCGFKDGLVKLPEQYTSRMFTTEWLKFEDDMIISRNPIMDRPVPEKIHLTQLMTLDIDKNPLYNEELSIKTAYMEDKEIEEMKQTPEFKEQNRQLMEKLRNEDVPHCPTCGSTNVSKIDAIDRAVSIGTLGIFSNKINKSFKCKDCGCTW
jgi:NAD-dependent SIR2 family protein deacetylase